MGALAAVHAMSKRSRLEGGGAKSSDLHDELGSPHHGQAVNRGFQDHMFRDKTTFHLRGVRMGIPPTGFFGRLLAVIAGMVLLVLGLMFSVVIIAVALTLGLAVWGWLWWKTRALRRQMREQMQAQSPFGPPPPDAGRVIEGEVIGRGDERSEEGPPRG